MTLVKLEIVLSLEASLCSNNHKNTLQENQSIIKLHDIRLKSEDKQYVKHILNYISNKQVKTVKWLPENKATITDPERKKT